MTHEIFNTLVKNLKEIMPELEVLKVSKKKMAMLFKWYFAQTMKFAFEGDLDNKASFQMHTGPALGAFNQWVKGTELESWRNRHVDEIGEKLMNATAGMLNEQLIFLGGTEQ